MIPGKLYRTTFGDSLKIGWDAVNGDELGDELQLNSLIGSCISMSTKEEVFMYVGLLTRKKTGGNYHVFLDGKGKLFTFSSGKYEGYFERATQ